MTKSIADIFCGAIREVPCFSGLVEYGTRSSRRFSDIDLMLVLKNFYSLGFYHEHLLRYPELIDLLKGGNIIIISEEVFEDILLIEDFNLSILGGMPPPPRIIDKNQMFYRDLVSIIDWVPERIGRLDYLTTANANQTEMIGVLYSLGHSFRYGARSIHAKYASLERDIKVFRKQLEVGVFNAKIFLNSYQSYRAAGIELVNTALNTLYAKSGDLSSRSFPNSFSYYKNVEIRIGMRDNEISPSIFLHLSNYQRIFEKFKIKLEFISGEIPIEHNPRVLIDNVMEAKAKTLLGIKIEEIKRYPYFSPLRFGYLL